MRVLSSPQELQKHLVKLKKSGKTIGFVPTMGALHEGHLSLIRYARKKCDVLVASIFVNPLQFGPKEDYKRYPRTLSDDKKVLSKAGVDFLFYPTPKQMYPEDIKVEIEVFGLSDLFEGASRPGHFRGVTTVVARLFEIVQPNFAVFGEKDFQQQLIVRKMVKALKLPVRIISMPTIREENGLAMSSRNRFLSEDEKKDARIISQALFLAQEMRRGGVNSAARVKKAAHELIALKPRVKIDYLEVVDANTLEKVNKLRPFSFARPAARILVAAKVGKVRLIDNLAL
jgi:pantoate--beta-alanine ligase